MFYVYIYKMSKSVGVPTTKKFTDFFSNALSPSTEVERKIR